VPQIAAVSQRAFHRHVAGHLLHPRLVRTNRDSGDAHPSAEPLKNDYKVERNVRIYSESLKADVPNASVALQRLKSFGYLCYLADASSLSDLEPLDRSPERACDRPSAKNTK
jgi:hypothetical protein